MDRIIVSPWGENKRFAALSINRGLQVFFPPISRTPAVPAPPPRKGGDLNEIRLSYGSGVSDPASQKHHQYFEKRVAGFGEHDRPVVGGISIQRKRGG